MGDLITFVVLPTMNLYGMFAIPIGRIYTNVGACIVTWICHLLTLFFLEDPFGYPPHS